MSVLLTRLCYSLERQLSRLTMADHPTKLLGHVTPVDMEDGLFRSVPWCASILADPAYNVIPTVWRTKSAYNTRMDILARTLKTPDTIAAWCTLLRRPKVSSRKASDVSRVLFALRSGLDGAPGTLKGGVTMLLFDGTVSLTAGLYRESEGLEGFNVTKELQVSYLAPVRTPCEVLVETRIVDISKNRRYLVQAELSDGHGSVLARAEAVCVAVSRPANL